MKKKNDKKTKDNNDEIKQLKQIISKQSKTINKLVRDNDKWRINFKESLSAYESLYNSLQDTKNELQSVLSSRFWTISEPIRNLLDTIKGKQTNNQPNLIETQDQIERTRYEKWIEENETNHSEFVPLKNNPLISIVVYPNIDVSCSDITIDSIDKQIYKNYEVLKPNGNINNIPTYLNQQLFKSKGDYILFVKSGDVLSDNALYEVVTVLNENNNIDFIYSDEDLIDLKSNKRYNPFFKTHFSPDTLNDFFYIGQLSVFKNHKVNKFDESLKDLCFYDFVLNYVDNINAENIYHISKILYHNKNDYTNTLASGKGVKNKYIKQKNLNATIQNNHIVYGNNNEKVSIIIPSKDNYDILKRCIDSIINVTTYNNFEIIVVDNGSNDDNKIIIDNYLSSDKGVKYIYDSYNFNFSKMCNIGANSSTGDYLLFLNDDTEIIQSNWLEIMLGHARLKHIGAVGVKLLYPNSNLIQHCGVTNYFFGPGHYFKKTDDSLNHYFYRNKANYNVLSVTAACMMIHKKKFYEIGCFNENLPNNYNDADLCFRLHDNGYYNIVLNNVELYHYESLSRGDSTLVGERMKNHLKEKNKLYELNPNYVCYDPFYNDNLTQENDSFDIEVF